MAHVAKYTKAASGHLAKHYERAKVFNEGTKEWEYVKFGNQDIDPSRTHLNYNLAPEREGGQMEFIKRRTTEARTLNRADVNVMCSWVVTMPEYEYVNKDIHVSADKDVLERRFFERSYRFLCDRYGEKNVVSAYVHMDETTPHMHFAFVPVTYDKKRGGEKVSAKTVVSQKDLQTFHTDLERHLDSFKDWHFEILNGATKDGNKTVAELKAETALQMVAKAEAKAIEAQGKVNDLEARKTSLEGEITALTTTKETLTEREVKELKAKKTLFGGLKGVTFKEYEALKRTAEKVESMSAEVEREKARAAAANLRADAAEERAENVVANANVQLKEKKEEVDRQLKEKELTLYKEYSDKTSGVNWELEQLRRENRRLTNKVTRLEQVIDYLKTIVREKLPEMAKTVESKVKQLMTHNQEKTR